MTPARFDLMNAIAEGGVQQSALWRRLQVVRSVVCEMLIELEALGWVERTRDERDGRTWRVTLTAYGRELFDRAYARWVASGDATVQIDSVLVNGRVESDPEPHRIGFISTIATLLGAFGWRRSGRDLYLWNPEGYYDRFADTSLPPYPGELPFVGQSSSDFESSAETS